MGSAGVLRTLRFGYRAVTVLMERQDKIAERLPIVPAHGGQLQARPVGVYQDAYVLRYCCTAVDEICVTKMPFPQKAVSSYGEIMRNEARWHVNPLRNLSERLPGHFAHSTINSLSETTRRFSDG